MNSNLTNPNLQFFYKGGKSLTHKRVYGRVVDHTTGNTTMGIRLEETEETFPSLRRSQTSESIPIPRRNEQDVEAQSVTSVSYRQTYHYRIIKYLSQFKIIHVPVLNWTILCIYLLLLYKLIHKYETLYETSALFTTVISNTLLYGLSDTLAQSLSCFYAMLSHQNRDRSVSVTFISLDNYFSSRDQPDDSFFADYGDTRVLSRHRNNSVSDNSNYQQLSEQTDADVFNFYRFIGFMFWGFFIAFPQNGWYWVLNHFYTQEPTFVSVLERVLSDQLVYSPVSLFGFFSYSNFVLERGDKFTLSEKIRKIYFSTLVANYMVWPLVQFINFLILPRRFQVPFSSSIGVIWNCFLSMRNASN